MKGFVFFLAALGVAAAAPSTFSLHDDLQDFLNLVPVNDVADIVIRYLSCDEETQNVVEYVMSPEFAQLVELIDNLPEYIEFLNYLQASGLEVYDLVNKLHELLGLAPLPVPAKFDGCENVTGGLTSLIEQVKAVLPREQIRALYEEKLESSPEFKALIKMLASDDFQSIVKTLNASPQFQELVAKAKAAGIDVSAIVQLLKELIGLQY